MAINHTMNKTNSKKILISVTFFCILCTVVVACTNTNNSMNTTQSPSETKMISETTPNAIVENTPVVTEQSKPMIHEIKNAVFLKGSFQISEDSIIDISHSMYIYDNEFIVINENVSDDLIKKLHDNGWEQHTFEYLEEGGYFIKCKAKGNGFSNSTQFMKTAQAFINDSGLYDYLCDMEIRIEFEIKGNEGQYVAFCYLLKNDRRTGSYIRMVFEDNKICSECKMYLYDSKIIGNLPTVPFDNALERAFYIDEHSNIKENQNGFLIKNITIKYVNGLPYYNFDAFGINTRSVIEGYALAVSYDSLIVDPDYLKKYYGFTR